MVQIEDDIYTKLKKDADDNNQIKNIVRIIAGVLIFLVLFFSWGKPVIDLDIQRRAYELQTEMSLAQAHTNKQIMEIESEGMTKQEYFKWLEVRKLEQDYSVTRSKTNYLYLITNILRDLNIIDMRINELPPSFNKRKASMYSGNLRLAISGIRDDIETEKKNDQEQQPSSSDN